MEDYLVKTIDYRDQVIKVYVDPEPESPREWDNLGTMVCFHKRYDLGDRTDLESDSFRSWGELESYLYREKDAVVVLPLYLYDHSGLRIKVGSFQGLLPQGHAEFDSGQVGFIYASKSNFQVNCGWKHFTAKRREKIAARLQQEVSTYDDYLSGNVYGYIAETPDGDHIDSCWGFIGDTEYMIEQAESSVDHYIESERKAHCDRLKQQIRAHAPLQYRQPLSI